MLDTIEGEALAMYREAKQDPATPPGIGTLARALLKTRVEAMQLSGQRSARLACVNGVWRIFVRRGTPIPRMAFDVAHELAHWWAKRCGYHGDDIEQICDALGAALVAPRPFFVAMRRQYTTVPRLARAICATQSLAALREGETVGTPVALVQPHRIMVRGEAWGWPGEQELRRVANAGHPALRRVKITDEVKRVALIAA